MAAMFGLENREVIRIKVKKFDGLVQPECKKFCVDPQITSYEILQNLLAKAFKIKSDFCISYLSTDENGEEAYLSLLSDWDLDAAFLTASDPYLRLKVDLKPFEDGLEDWDIVRPADVSPKSVSAQLLEKTGILGNITGSITTHVGKTVSQAAKVMGLTYDENEAYRPAKAALCDAEFHGFLDAVGHVVAPQQFRVAVYQGGVDAALRRVVWRHLLNVYPLGMSGKQRFEYFKQKSAEYYRLRDEWKDMFSNNTETEEVKYVTNMVKKDVLRTDRTHPFYAGDDDNGNVLALFNVLVTYALTHPDVSYCQGMSDIASPILVVQNDEAHAYITFCAAMRRLKPNFYIVGEAMTKKFQHLALILQHNDPLFFAYMKAINADDMFFCYRWLLLELKREFPFDDAMFMLETMWSSLPPDPPETELELFDPTYKAARLGCSPASPTVVNPYMRLRSQRRQVTPSPDTSLSAVTPCEDRSKIDPKDFQAFDDKTVDHLKEKSCNIDRSLGSSISHSSHSSHSNTSLGANGRQQNSMDTVVETELRKLAVSQPVSQPDPSGGDNTTEHKKPKPTPLLIPKGNMDNTAPDSPKRPTDIPLKQSFEPGKTVTIETEHMLVSQNGSITEQTVELNSCEEAIKSEHPSIDFVKVSHEKPPPLPPPHEFGAGNPFLIFLCLTLLLQQRDHIMAHRMDYNDLAMHFDKMVRKHNVYRVLHQAKSLYAVYLRQQASAAAVDSEEEGVEDVSV